MKQRKAINIATATMVATSAFVAVSPKQYEAATGSVDKAINKATKQIEKAYDLYYKTARNKGELPSTEEIRRQVKLAQKYYADAVKVIKKDGGSKSKQAVYTKRLDAKKTYLERVEKYVTAININVKSAKTVFQKSVETGKQKDVLKKQTALNAKIAEFEVAVTKVYGPDARKLLLEKYAKSARKEADSVKDEMKVYKAYKAIESEKLIGTDLEKASKLIDSVKAEVAKLEGKDTLLAKNILKAVSKNDKAYLDAKGIISTQSGLESVITNVKEGDKIEIKLQAIEDLKIKTNKSFTITLTGNLNRKDITIDAPNAHVTNSTENAGKVTIIDVSNTSYEQKGTYGSLVFNDINGGRLINSTQGLLNVIFGNGATVTLKGQFGNVIAGDAVNITLDNDTTVQELVVNGVVWLTVREGAKVEKTSGTGNVTTIPQSTSSSATKVVLVMGSLGTAADKKITGLIAGTYYIVKVDGKTYGVQASGTLGVENSISEALTGTEITSLRNGKSYKVEVDVARTKFQTAKVKVEALQTTASKDLTVETNLQEAETAVEEAGQALTEVAEAYPGKSELVTQYGTDKEKVEEARTAATKFQTAKTKVEALKTTASKDLTVETNLQEAETAVEEAKQALAEVAGVYPGKSELVTQYGTDKEKVEEARTATTKFQMAKTKVEALKTAASKDLTIETNLQEAETAIGEAEQALAEIAEAYPGKLELVVQYEADSLKVEEARTAVTKFQTAKAKMESLKTAASKDLTIETNLQEAETVVEEARQALAEVAEAYPGKSELIAQYEADSLKVEEARTAATKFQMAKTKVESLKTATSKDLTIETNLQEVETAVEEAKQALAEVTEAYPGKSELVTQYEASKLKVEEARVVAAKFQIAKTKVEVLRTAVSKDLTIETNLQEAEVAVEETEQALIEVAEAYPGKSELVAQYEADSLKVEGARTAATKFQTAKTKVEALKTAASKDLTIETNLQEAKVAVEEAKQALTEVIGAYPGKSELVTQYEADSLKVEGARQELDTVTTAIGKVATNDTVNITVASGGSATDEAKSQAVKTYVEDLVQDNTVTIAVETEVAGRYKIILETGNVTRETTIQVIFTAEAQSIISKTITNFDFSTVYATQAKLVSKTVTVGDFTGNRKDFTIVVGGERIPIYIDWALSKDFSKGAAMGGVVESHIQQYYLDKGGINALMNRPIYASGTTDTFQISAFQSGSASSFALEGKDWSYFFDQQTAQGTDMDTSKNRTFTVNDGTNIATIQLTSSFTTIDALVDRINNRLTNASVKAKAEKISEKQFKITSTSTAGKLIIDGMNKADFFE
ncbi:hypothetical protein [Peribacillus asahii]|uniref:hypothetical protein n=1 Tax=Peribacillus asahii TaxID=228899 RepID=UPI00207AB7C5|nr:hypothetical protein [Peribacillus asahii]USK70053.1 hypothetical protein LIS76_21595 [Peribacillus asahii]